MFLESSNDFTEDPFWQYDKPCNEVFDTILACRNTEIDVIWPLFSVYQFKSSLSKAAVAESPFIRISAGKKDLLAGFLVERALNLNLLHFHCLGSP